MRIENGRHRVAIVVARLAGGGGVPAVAEFLYQAIDRSTMDKLPTAGFPGHSTPLEQRVRQYVAWLKSCH
jgi:hypothetical protein